MELKDFTLAQLERMYCRLYSQLPDGGGFGWDWRTLRHAYPGLAFALHAVWCAARDAARAAK